MKNKINNYELFICFNQYAPQIYIKYYRHFIIYDNFNLILRVI
jgi:hypothetical protein